MPSFHSIESLIDIPDELIKSFIVANCFQYILNVFLMMQEKLTKFNENLNLFLLSNWFK